MRSKYTEPKVRLKTLVTFLAILFNLFISEAQNKYLSRQDVFRIHSDPGQLFIDAVRSESKDERLYIIRNIFSSKTLKDPGEERLLSLFEGLKMTLGETVYHSSEVTETQLGDGTTRSIMHVFTAVQGSKKWNDIQLQLDPEEKGKILKLVFIAEVTEPVYLPNGSIEQQQTIEWLNKYFEKLQDENSFYGSMMISKGNKILFEKYAGFSNPSKTLNFDAGTRMNMASGSKMFTAIAIAQLVAEGLLKYNDKIAGFFPGFEDKGKSDKVTVHHLLTHTSGVAEYWTENNRSIISNFSSLSEYLPLIYKEGFLFEPDTEFGYSNSNFILLGLIIEKITGLSYYEYVKNHILAPAGMNSTDYYYYGTDEQPIALPLERSSDGWKELFRSKSNSRGSSAGGCYTTLYDMLKFTSALKNNVLISRDELDNMTKDKVYGYKDAIGYGYGFEITNYGKNGVSYGHGGITRGVNFEYRYFPEYDITLVICCNQDNGAFDDLKKNTVKLITGDR
ncbi:MAG TPA: serine hydrolase domain-containing protein [Ignavibacteria bacterium]|nr:serine hydrolase domain-containing protein [Ignavibacteria bacterium]HMQ98869.1 serine hydrolase domain-containing protein [Ignavibacteria bacterium]